MTMPINTLKKPKTLLAQHIFTLLLAGIASHSWAADVESHQAEPSNAPITSLPFLSSLRNIQHDASKLNTPKIQQITTKTGTPALFVAANELPIVDIRLTFDAGSARDSEIRDGLYGLASLTAQLLDEGTSTQNTDDIAATFERLGAEYSANSYRDMFAVNLRVLADPEHFNPAVDQLLAILKDAQFPQDSIDRVLKNAAIGQKQKKESPGAIVGIRFYRELYGKHPYAEPSTGTEASLKKIKPEDIRKFKDTFLVAKNLNISITGQLSTEQAKALADRISQSLPLGEKAKALPDPAPLASNRIVPVKFDSTQSHVIIGQIGIKRDDPAMVPLAVGNEMLGGGGFNALLMKELREKRGLTYGAYSGFTSMRSNGPFMISYSTRGDQAVDSIQVAQQTLRNFISQPIDQSLLDETKEGILNSYPLSLASNESINGYLAMIGFYNLPLSYMSDYPQKIQAVTAGQIQDAMRSHINPDKMLTVVVGQPFDSKRLSQPIAPATPASQPESAAPGTTTTTDNALPVTPPVQPVEDTGQPATDPVAPAADVPAPVNAQPAGTQP